MRVTTPTEDSALAESTFELINGTDVESHDENENYTESISESVGSLDFHRPDDVQSLAGTEHTLDDESLVDEEVDILSHSVAQNESTGVHNDESELAQQASDGSESEEEARSRCSLEYTQQSLKTPSILTPEASKIIGKALETTNKVGTPHENYRYWMAVAKEGMLRTWECATVATTAALPGLVFAVAFSLLISMLYPSTVEFNQPAETIVTSTITATTTPAVVYTKQTTATSSAAKQTTSAKGMGLIPVNDQESDEWLFGSKKPEVQFSPLGHGAIMVHVASDVKRTWLKKKKNCVSVTASRSGEAVEMEFYPSDDGFLIQFPKREARGVVKLLLEATCRPAVTKAVKVHFGKGIMEEAYEMTKNLAHDLSEFVPVAAQEAERCLVGAKKSIGAVSDTVASGVVTVSDSLMGRMKMSSAKIHNLLENLPSWSVKYAEDVVNKVPQSLGAMYKQASEAVKSHRHVKVDIQDGILDAQLYFLKTRISAKMWWLKVTRQTTEHEEYGEKAKAFVANKRREGRNQIRKSFRDANDQRQVRFGRPKRSRCKQNNRKGRDIHVCKMEA
ncbi:hypothetical protein VFPPC_08260 [Pochonia chlamydosporia 170]|uniref:Uncharacterized protein n=1 Tax=Pochonia chlamydosporia 170 TaxID=1380566 RepID=A0A179FN71_METCM|nr:hypothetical protein VFPPC_08260 [Pochonia chlamydosporia 170]OAQ66738.1 hypothetical protein VFPPC_08260 [Pochonia chlamydosporia 170]